MMKVGVLCSVIRVEEKLLFQKLEERGVDVERLDDRRIQVDLAHGLRSTASRPYDVIFERCINHSRALASLQMLGSLGIATVNTAQVTATCGDKLQMTSTLNAAGVPMPRIRIVYTRDGALEAMEELGYPVVLKPVVGSWGRLMSRVHNRDAAESLLEHKALLGTESHSIFYIQEYIDKPMRDIRAFVIGSNVIGAIYRHSSQWITNTARGGKASICLVTPELHELSLKAARAVGGGIVAVDLVEDPDQGLLVLEVNHTMEFRNSTTPTGVDIPGHMVDFVLRVGREGWAAANQSSVSSV